MALRSGTFPHAALPYRCHVMCLWIAAMPTDIQSCCLTRGSVPRGQPQTRTQRLDSFVMDCWCVQCAWEDLYRHLAELYSPPIGEGPTLSSCQGLFCMSRHKWFVLSCSSTDRNHNLSGDWTLPFMQCATFVQWRISLKVKSQFRTVPNYSFDSKIVLHTTFRSVQQKVYVNVTILCQVYSWF